MSNIIDTQDEIIAKINALITAGTLSAGFTTQDNDIDYGNLPLAIVDLKTSDAGEYGNLADGGTALLDHVLELIVVVAMEDSSHTIRTARKYAIDNFMVILNSLAVDCGVVYHEAGLYKEKNCVRVRTLIGAFDNG